MTIKYNKFILFIIYDLHYNNIHYCLKVWDLFWNKSLLLYAHLDCNYLINLFGQEYSNNSNTVKYSYNLKYFFNNLIDFEAEISASITPVFSVTYILIWIIITKSYYQYLKT